MTRSGHIDPSKYKCWKLFRATLIDWLKVRSQNLREQFLFHLFRTCRWLGGGVFNFWSNPTYIKQNKRKDHSIVVCSVAWPLNCSEATGDLFLIQTSLFLLCKSSYSNSNFSHLQDKSEEVCIKPKSLPASLPFKDQVTFFFNCLLASVLMGKFRAS